MSVRTARREASTETPIKDLYEIGEIPPLGHVPEKMYAWVVRKERHGPPEKAMQVEVVPTWPLDSHDVLVLVMAAGVNYNGVWAALGEPVSTLDVHKNPYHIAGSDASGIVWAVGEGVENVRVGDQVVAHCGVWDAEDPWIVGGGDPIIAPSARIWGYETNWGSFAQYTLVQAHQLLPKPPQLTWAAAAAATLVGATAYRMLCSWPPHTVREGDVVLIWGGSGGLGSQAIQIARAKGAIPVAVTSGPERGKYCMDLGARGYIDRRDFSHWGVIPDWRDDAAFATWTKGARAFGKALWDVVGERRNPRIVFEHPGEDTIPTSIFVCDNGGMVVICAGTTGYHAAVDLRYLWMRQKRLQGSHFANDDECAAFNAMVTRGEVDPCLSRTFAFDEVGLAHQLMRENKHPMGNMAILVGAHDASERD